MDYEAPDDTQDKTTALHFGQPGHKHSLRQELHDTLQHFLPEHLNLLSRHG